MIRGCGLKCQRLPDRRRRQPDLCWSIARSRSEIVRQATTDSGQVLTVRTDPGRGAKAVAKVPRGTLFTIKSGPVQQDNLTWWELESDTVDGWAAAGMGRTAG